MKAWHEVERSSPLIRKSVSLLKQAPRAWRRWTTGGDSPPVVLANSIPKSGTHLLLQILAALPGARNYDSFITTLPAMSYRVRSEAAVRRRLDRCAPGELVSGHLYYRESYAEWIAQRNIQHFFIFRDPRDIAVSEALYLTRMTRWHRLHRHYARVLRSDEERIRFSITGSPRVAGVAYEDIGRRCRRFLGWRERDDVCAVRFEDLVGGHLDRELDRIAAFHAERTGKPTDREPLVRSMRANIDPERSRTFRQGRAGAWADCFTEEHKDLFKSKAGGLLQELGYETDDRW